MLASAAMPPIFGATSTGGEATAGALGAVEEMLRVRRAMNAAILESATTSE